ncbi:hypothetical protein LP414_32130 [Polaromonas sp. P1(28)-13]|nr:hypothetical protein LP414_32130 [Polaromonas sp. P1(28)-13]
MNSFDAVTGPTRRRVLVSGAVALGWPALGLSQSGGWQPAKPIRIIVSQAPGGSTDTTARAYADFLSIKLGVPVTVENRTGAAGMIAGCGGCPFDAGRPHAAHDTAKLDGAGACAAEGSANRS